ncbi:MAG: hypothetical protein MJZ68_09435, partial [archaeon]|nr:hypothetical protein [archaeon]
MTANSKLIGKMLRNQVAVTVLESVTSCLGLLFCAVIVGQHVGSDALVAFQLILPLAMVIIAAAGLIYNGGSISCSKYLGEGDFQKVNSNYTMITITGAVGSIAVMVACLLFAEPLAVILGASDHIHEMTVDIIRCLGLMGLPFILFQVNLYYFKMDNDQRICVVSALSYMVTVVGFALFFSMFTDLGLLGIGFALDISSYIAWGVSLLHFRNPDRFLKFVKPIDMKNDFLSAMRAGL